MLLTKGYQSCKQCFDGKSSPKNDDFYSFSDKF